MSVTIGEQEFPTGVYFGVGQLMQLLEKYFNGPNIIFAIDQGSSRYEMDEEYKSDRANHDHIHEYTDVVKKMVAMTPHTVVESEGHEADDVIASLFYSLKDKFDEVYIFATDNDFLQLMSEGLTAQVYRLNDKELVKYDQAYVTKKYGVPMDCILTYRALSGDSSDNIKPPIPRLNTAFKVRLAIEWKKHKDLDVALNVLAPEYPVYVGRVRMAKEKVLHSLQLMSLRKYRVPGNRVPFKVVKDLGGMVEVQKYKLSSFERWLKWRRYLA